MAQLITGTVLYQSDLAAAARVVVDITTAACGSFLGGLLAFELLKRVPVTAPKPARPQRRSPMERELSYLPSERFDIGDELYASLPNHAFPHWYVSIQGFGYDVVYVLFHSIVRKPDGASCAPRHVETQTTAAWLPLSRHWDGTAPPPIHVPKHVLDCVTKQLIGVLPST